MHRRAVGRGKIGYVLLVNNDDAGKVDQELRAYLITGKVEVTAD